MLNAFDEWSLVKRRYSHDNGTEKKGGGDERGGTVGRRLLQSNQRARSKRRRRGKGSRAWCRRHGLIEQRLVEGARLVKQFRQLMVSCGFANAAQSGTLARMHAHARMTSGLRWSCLC